MKHVLPRLSQGTSLILPAAQCRRHWNFPMGAPCWNSSWDVQICLLGRAHVCSHIKEIMVTALNQQLWILYDTASWDQIDKQGIPKRGNDATSIGFALHKPSTRQWSSGKQHSLKACQSVAITLRVSIALLYALGVQHQFF